MTRIHKAFDAARADSRSALIVYITAGDPDLGTTVRLVLAAAAAGADVIELGMPFSDPTADGEAIQRASERALAAGTTLVGVFEVVRKVRASSEVPIVLFGYYNPIHRFDEAAFVNEAAEAGVDGLLVVDLPPEEGELFHGHARRRGLDIVPLVAPTSNESRVRLAGSVATSFVYYVSVTGVTGSKAAQLDVAAVKAAELQKRLGKSVALGFGVKSRLDVATVARYVDGVVVGSAIMTVIEHAGSPDAAVAQVSELVRELRAGTRR